MSVAWVKRIMGITSATPAIVYSAWRHQSGVCVGASAIDVDLARSVTEAAEWFTVVLGNASAGATLGTPSLVTVTITDNDRLTQTLRILDRILAVGPNWTAQDDVPWLTLSQSSGTGPSTIAATVDPSGLPLGTYTGTIVVTGDTGNSPQLVGVTLQVVP